MICRLIQEAALDSLQVDSEFKLVEMHVEWVLR
jgi:hypothetical protein